MAECDTICPTVEYSDLKKDPQNYVEVRADIKGLEKKLLGKANADINLDMTERSFLLSVDLHTLKGSGKVTKYRYEVKRLPAEIDPKKSRYEVKSGKVILYLCKAVPGSWARQLAGIGLEHEQDAS